MNPPKQHAALSFLLDGYIGFWMVLQNNYLNLCDYGNVPGRQKWRRDSKALLLTHTNTHIAAVSEQNILKLAQGKENHPNMDLVGKSFILRLLLENNKHNTIKRSPVKSFKGKSSLCQLWLCFGSFLNKHSFIRDLARPEKWQSATLSLTMIIFKLYSWTLPSQICRMAPEASLAASLNCDHLT